MVTQELLGYIQTEVAKGKTREEIRGALLSGGGWSEDDLSEAFRTIIPMQNVILPEEKPTPSSYSPLPLLLKSTPLSKSLPSSRSSLWQNLVFIVIGLLCVFSWYFYRPQIINFWNSYVNNSEKLSVNSWNSLVNNFRKLSIPSLPSFSLPSFKLPSFSFKFPFFNFGKIFGTDKVPVVNNIVAPTPKGVEIPIKNVKIKDCGISATPKLDTPSTYENDPILSCLGASALNCENAKGILKDDFFPTVFEINKSQSSCNFKLSYPADSALTDITGKKLAGQYISCPINIVKAIDNTKATSPKFNIPDKTNLSKYASQIYFYGTLGLLVENNLDQNKIQNLGCSGEYIQSVIASYRLTHPK